MKRAALAQQSNSGQNKKRKNRPNDAPATLSSIAIFTARY
jgi:hypothetical protein